ncbi:MAG: glycosyltransferase family 1 protein [Desulfitobacteriaceae bacterium]|nr:glycosyltransferase family 1 protein [Desulfitobacteriaceae bacterium]
MKIAVNALQVSENNSGIGWYIINLVSKLIEQPEHFFNIYLSQGVHIDQWERKNHVSFNHKSFRKEEFFRRNIFEIFGFSSSIKKYQPDIFFAPDTKLPWGLGSNVKEVVTVHDLAVFKYPATYQKSRVLYWQKHFASSVKRADRVVAISQSTKRDLIEVLRVPEEKIIVIYNGVGEEFQPVTDSAECLKVREKYRLPERYILFVGTFSPRKNLGRLIKAFGLLRRETNLPHKLVIAGEKGWKYREDLERVKDLSLEDQIVFPGFVDSADLPVVYSMADVLAYPSLYEGFGLPQLYDSPVSRSKLWPF